MARYILVPRPVSTPPGGGSGPTVGFETNPFPTPPSGEPIEADVEVTVPPSGLYPLTSDRFVLRSVVPIDPRTSLPTLYLEGRRAQVDGHSRTANGSWSTVLVSGLVPKKAAGQRYTIRETGSLQDPSTLWNDDLTGLRLEIKVANVAQTFEADFFGYGSPETIYNGAYLQTKRYWAPFVRTSGGSEEVLMCIVFVTRRADVPVYEFDVMITNSKCDTAESPFDTQDAIDGNVYFDYIKLTGLPVGWQTRTLVDRSLDGFPVTELDLASTPYLVSYTAATPATQHVIGPRQCIVRRFVLGDTNLYSTEMLDICEWRDRGTVYGPNSYFMREQFSAMGYAVPHPSPNLVYHGFTGRAAVAEYDREDWVATRSTLATGYDQGSGTWVDRDAQDWQHPTGSSGTGIGGNDDLEVSSGWHQNYYAHLLYRFEADARMEARPVFIYDRQDGMPGDVHKWAQANSAAHLSYDLTTPGAANKYPWDAMEITGSISGRNPLFQPQTGGLDQDESLLPTSRPWNSKDPDTICPWESAFLQENGGSEFDYYHQHKGTHALRTFGMSIASAWSTGDVVAREHIRAVAGFYIGPNEYGVQGFIRFSGYINDPGSCIDMPNRRTYLTGAGSDFANKGWGGWDRGLGWRVLANVTRYALETDAYRDQPEELERWQGWVDLLDLVASPIGITYRQAPQNSTSSTNNDIWKESFHGATDYASRLGAVTDGRDSYPTGPISAPAVPCWDCQKTWQQMYCDQASIAVIKCILSSVDTVRAATLRTRVQQHGLLTMETIDHNASGASSFYYEWIPVGESDPTNPNNGPAMTAFTQLEVWNQPNTLGPGQSWTKATPWLMYQIDGDRDWLERDLYTEGQYDPVAGAGNQDLAAWAEYTWTGDNASQTIPHGASNGFQAYTAAHTRALIHIVSGVNEQWMNEQAP